MSALAIVPVPPRHTLYDISDTLLALLDTAEMHAEGSPERIEIDAEIARAADEQIRKVDGIVHVMLHLESQATFAGEEAKRLQARKKSFENRYERLEWYCIQALKLQPQPKRGPKKLEGELRVLTLKSPEVVVITDEESVPDEYKRAIVTLEVADFNRVLEECPWLKEKCPQREIQVLPAECKAALKAGLEVTGADLKPSYSVGIK